MTTQQVADRFHELAEQGQYQTIQDELYAQDVVSVEPNEAFGPREAHGLDAIKEKSRLLNESIEEMHGGWCSKPAVGGKYFTVAMGMDVTMKGRPRGQMNEVCVYEVQDGKVVKEQFFF